MKLTTKDLRVRNLVKTEYEGILEIVNINSEGFDYVDLRKQGYKAIGRHSIEFVEPIPLTEEWLLRFGFKKVSICEYELKIITYDTPFCDSKESELYVNLQDSNFKVVGENTLIF
jgi:hypothetical protein